jgi:glycosyltransferase involved in cell wall biosynthesis
MKIVIVNMSPIPVFAYGGTERVIWDLGKSLVEYGHEVSFLVPKGSTCDFAKVIEIDPLSTWEKQIPKDTDVVHFQFQPINTKLDIPIVVTEHGNADINKALHINTIFLSKNHAERHGSSCYVYNGLDWRNYGEIDWNIKRDHYHFLGKAAWRLKNVSGAIDIAKRLEFPLYVLGGNRFNFKRGIRLTFTPKAKFFGMVGGQEKLNLLNTSRGLIFPVRWHEPFGLAIIESMYFGCPIFSTPYGAIPELVPQQCGELSTSSDKLIQAIRDREIDPFVCHQHVVDEFNVKNMMYGYLEKYKIAINGKYLNQKQPCLMETSNHLIWN